MYNTVLFDLDGTIVDSKKGIFNSIEYALNKYGEKMPPRSTLGFFLGPPLEASFSKLLDIEPETASVLVKYYREYYSVTGIFEIEIYEGIIELLEKIKASGRKTVIATSKPEEFALRVLKRLGIEKYFDVVAGATFDNTRSEKNDVIAYALEKAAISDKKTVVMVGDRSFDCFGAMQCGIDSIGVLYGFGSKEELEGASATYLAKTPSDIYKFL